MSDLVKRARAAYHLIDTDHTGLIEELADEIERLRELCQHHGKNCNELILRAEKNLLDDMRAWIRDLTLNGEAEPFPGFEDGLDTYEKARK